MSISQAGESTPLQQKIGPEISGRRSPGSALPPPRRPARGRRPDLPGTSRPHFAANAGRRPTPRGRRPPPHGGRSTAQKFVSRDTSDAQARERRPLVDPAPQNRASGAMLTEPKRGRARKRHLLGWGQCPACRNRQRPPDRRPGRSRAYASPHSQAVHKFGLQIEDRPRSETGVPSPAAGPGHPASSGQRSRQNRPGQHNTNTKTPVASSAGAPRQCPPPPPQRPPPPRRRSASRRMTYPDIGDISLLRRHRPPGTSSPRSPLSPPAALRLAPDDLPRYRRHVPTSQASPPGDKQLSQPPQPPGGAPPRSG